MNDTYDVVVVGGEPAGLSATLVLGRQRRRVLLVDAGEPRNASAAEMHMYLGRDGADPAQLLADGRAEVDVYPTVTRRAGRVTGVRGALDDFTLDLDDGTEVRTRRLLLAGGQVDEPLDVPGLAQRWGGSVFHCPFCHGYETTGMALVVIGNGLAGMLAAYVRDRFSDDVVLATHGPAELPGWVAGNLEARGVRVVESPSRPSTETWAHSSCASPTAPPSPATASTTAPRPAPATCWPPASAPGCSTTARSPSTSAAGPRSRGSPPPATRPGRPGCPTA